MGSGWDFVASIPAIDLPIATESDTLAAIGSGDKRYQLIKSEKPNIGKFLDSFQTPFGKKVTPSIIIKKANSDKVNVNDLITFRNLIAISSVIKSKIDTYHYKRLVGCPFTDLLDIYPIYPSSQDDDWVVISSAVETGLDSLEHFKGHLNPVVIYPDNFRLDFDVQLRDSLLRLWKTKYNEENQNEIVFKNQIFRSIGMVYQALRAPYDQMGSQTDYGILFSLYVSAFEVLANPNNQNVHFRDVSALINKVPWHTKILKEKKYNPIDCRNEARKHTGRQLPKTTIPVQIYGRLFNLRIKFLHGSPLPEKGIEPDKKEDWGPLELQIPALYRSILLYVLSSKGFGEFPRDDIRYGYDQMEQGRIEEILYKKFEKDETFET